METTGEYVLWWGSRSLREAITVVVHRLWLLYVFVNGESKVYLDVQ